MVFVLCFLGGVMVGALLVWHLGRVAELRRKAEAFDRARGS